MAEIFVVSAVSRESPSQCSNRKPIVVSGSDDNGDGVFVPSAEDSIYVDGEKIPYDKLGLHLYRKCGCHWPPFTQVGGEFNELAQLLLILQEPRKSMQDGSFDQFHYGTRVLAPIDRVRTLSLEYSMIPQGEMNADQKTSLSFSLDIVLAIFGAVQTMPKVRERFLGEERSYGNMQSILGNLQRIFEKNILPQSVIQKYASVVALNRLINQ